MRRILFHAGMSPLEQPSLCRAFRKNLFTTNSGNLLFQYGTYRALMTEDADITTTLFERPANRTAAAIARINAEYDCAVMPMANNFRGSYDLKPLTALVRQLKIPCAVLGIGLQAPNASAINNSFPFDHDVKDFVSAVLERSAMLGVRGEMTADYLSRLGFAPERHFTVIGCPSMYSHGARLPDVKPLALTAESRVNFGYRIDQLTVLAGLLNRCMALFLDYHIVAQRREEIFMIRYGGPVHYTYDKANRCASLYPHDRNHPALREGRMVGFIGAHAWLEFMKQQDFNLGSRIHGNIAAVLAGTPTLALTLDTRMEELCRYHNIPYVPAERVDAETDPRALCEGVDFARVQEGHARRFDHFVDFLNANGLEHVYRNGDPGETPMDRAIAALPAWGMIAPPEHITLSDRVERLAILNYLKLRRVNQKLVKAIWK